MTEEKHNAFTLASESHVRYLQLEVDCPPGAWAALTPKELDEMFSGLWLECAVPRTAAAVKLLQSRGPAVAVKVFGLGGRLDGIRLFGAKTNEFVDINWLQPLGEEKANSFGGFIGPVRIGDVKSSIVMTDSLLGLAIRSCNYKLWTKDLSIFSVVGTVDTFRRHIKDSLTSLTVVGSGSNAAVESIKLAIQLGAFVANSASSKEWYLQPNLWFENATKIDKHWSTALKEELALLSFGEQRSLLLNINMREAWDAVGVVKTSRPGIYKFGLRKASYNPSGWFDVESGEQLTDFVLCRTDSGMFAEVVQGLNKVPLTVKLTDINIATEPLLHAHLVLSKMTDKNMEFSVHPDFINYLTYSSKLVEM